MVEGLAQGGRGLGRVSKALGPGGGWGLGGLESGGDRMDVCPDIPTNGWKEISPLFFGSAAKIEIP